MKRILLSAALLSCAAMTAHAQISGTININQPGAYGRIDFGQAPPPTVIYAQPVIIAPTRVATYQRPVYLYVPPGHAKDWGKHCSHYNACGQPVYFVQEDWVRKRYEEEHSRDHHDNGHGKGHGHDDKHDDRHEDHGHGHGHDD